MLNNENQLHGAAAMFAEKWNKMERKTAPDGAGGWITQWMLGVEFEGARNKDISTEARIAEAQGVVSSFTIAIPVNFPLLHNDYIQRQKDGTYWRVTSDPADTETHPSFPVQEKQATLEKVEVLPK